jgi:DNA ligase-1
MTKTDPKPFRPMLACKVTDLTTVKYPVMCTPKLDGIRCVIREGKALSRTLLPIPNVHVREWLEQNCAEGWDGELMLPPPATFQDVSSAFMTQKKAPPEGWYFGVFDRVLVPDPAISRYCRGLDMVACKRPHVRQVPLRLCDTPQEVLVFEEEMLAQGMEGIMLRDPAGPYKFGRSTLREGYLLKLKRFLDSEAEVIGVVERCANTNEATTSELGLTKRSHAKAGRVANGALGALQVRDVKTGVEFEIGSGFTEHQRVSFWLRQKALIGQLAKYKYFPVGTKDKPRHPIWLGWRSREDM